MNDQETPELKKGDGAISRRTFMKHAGNVIVVIGIGDCTSGSSHPESVMLDDGKSGIPISQGYLLVDTRKCQGCLSCMLACSLVHDGRENLSLARIQIIQNPFSRFPDDLTLDQCRQCLDPACLKACPEDALIIDNAQGNVRRIVPEKCVGCLLCIEACTYDPSRMAWNAEEMRVEKCDLCAVTPYWQEKGGPFGKQACVEICPLGAVVFTEKLPVQKGDRGYKVNLRGKDWEKLGYSRS